MEVASLGLAVDSSQADKGAISLERLSSAAKRAESATRGLAGGANASSTASAAAAGSANRAAAALNVEAAAATKAANAMHVHGKAVNDNARRMGGSMSGLAAQFQDIGVTAAMGMNPALIALQQGTQIAGQMEMAMQSGAKATDVLGTAFRSLFSPLTFVTIALTALAAVGLQMVDWAGLAAAALRALASVLQTIAPYAAMAAAGLALLYAPAIIGGVVSLIALLGRLAVSALAVAGAMAAANPAAAFVLGITAAVAAANIFRDELTQIFGVDIVGAAKTGANYVIGSFVAAYEDIKFVWNNFGNIIGAAITGAVNAVVDGVNTMIQKAATGVDWLIDKLNQIPGVNLEKIGSVGDIVPKWKNDYAAKAGAALEGRNKAVADALSRDYLGEFGAGITKGASAASAKLKELAADLTKVDEKTKKKGGGGKTDGEKFSDIVRDADAKIAALRAEQAGLGQTAEAAARLRYEQELLNKATQAGLTLDPQQIALLKAKAAEMASVEAATKRAKENQDALNEAGKGFGGILKGLLDGTMTWKDALQAAIPILLKLLDTMNKAGGGKGIFGGGFLQSILQGFFGFAKGGYTGNKPAHAPAGIVHGGEFVFSKKATDRIGVGNLTRAHNAAKGYAQGGYVAPITPRMQAPATDQPLRIEVVSRFDADGGFDTAVERVAGPVATRESVKMGSKVAKAVPGMVDARNDEAKYRRIRPQFAGVG